MPISRQTQLMTFERAAAAAGAGLAAVAAAAETTSTDFFSQKNSLKNLLKNVSRI
jgi:hypothetical protein